MWISKQRQVTLNFVLYKYCFGTMIPDHSVSTLTTCQWKRTSGENWEK